MTSSVRVLHVDDDPDFGDLVSDFLERENERLDVRTETSAGDAIETIRDGDTEIDCVVSDYDMPGKNGIEFLEDVRDEYPELPFILFTGKGSEEVAGDAISAGATDYLQKGGGTEQYKILANRVRNAVGQYRATQRATNLERLRNLAAEINQDLVRASSRDEIEREVCENFSDAVPYLFAWVGERDPDANRLEPRVSAGDGDAYLDAVTSHTDDRSTGRGPARTAVRERRIAVSQNVAEDPAFESRKEAALERGFRSVAAVPLEYADESYGVLVVYASQIYAFDEDERALLEELADDIGHAIHARDIRQNLERFKTLLDQTNDAIFVIGPETGEFLEVNERACQHLGYEEEELLDLTVPDVDTTIADVDDYSAIVERARGGGSVLIEGIHANKDGSTHPVEISANYLELGTQAYLVAIARDVSNRKERERELERYERMMERLPVGVFRTTADGDFVQVNSMVPSLLGVESKEELYAHDVREFWTDPRNRGDLLERLRAEKEVETDVEIEPQSGESIRAAINAVLVEEQGHTYLEGIIQDVTDRYRQRQRQQRQQDALLELTRNEAVVEGEFDTAIQRITETAADVLDVSRVNVWLFDDDEDRLDCVDHYERPTDEHETGTTLDVTECPTYFEALETHRVIDADDAREDSRTAELADDYLDPQNVGALLDGTLRAEGEVVGVICHESVAGSREWTADEEEFAASIADIVHRALRNRESKRRERRLRRQNERFDELASAVSHDLQTPLETARGRTELAIETGDAEHMERALTAVERADELREDLADVLRTGEIVGDTEPVDLGQAATATWEIITTPEETSLQVEGSPRVDGDPDALRRLLENLLSNSVEHGEADVTVRVGEDDGGFYVEDDGPGIPPEDRDEVFTPGYSTKEGGNGVGMASVRQIVLAHDWSVAVTESETGGARFEIETCERVDDL